MTSPLRVPARGPETGVERSYVVSQFLVEEVKHERFYASTRSCMPAERARVVRIAASVILALRPRPMRGTLAAAAGRQTDDR